MRRGRVRHALLAVGIVVVSAGLVLPGVPAAPRAPALTVALESLGEETFLPATVSGSIFRSKYLGAVYDYLLHSDSDWHASGKYLPGLAERWAFSGDGTTVTFWLRKGARFHGDWGEVTAEDVKFTAELIMSDPSRAQRKDRYRQQVKRIQVVDKHTIRFELDPPNLDFLYEWSDLFGHEVGSQAYIRRVGPSQADRAPVGSGPYRFVEHKPGESVTLEASDDYWGGAPGYRRLTFRAVPEVSTRAAMLRTGEVGIANVTADIVEDLVRAGVKAVKIPNAYTVHFAFGGLYIPSARVYDSRTHGKDPWSEKRVREAMNIAINREEIVRRFYRGFADHAAVPWFGPGWNKLNPYPFDVQRARRLLTEAGFPDGFAFEMPVYPHGAASEIPQLAELIAGYWRAVGIRANLRPTTFAAWRPSYIGGRTGGVVYPLFGPVYGDWGSPLRIFLSNQGHSINVMHPDLDAIQARLDNERLTARQRAELYARAAKVVYDEFLLIPIAAPARIFGANRRVTDIVPVAGAGLEFRYEKLKPGP